MVTEYLGGTPFRVDNFQFTDGCMYYMLSHAHADHLVGLTPTWCNGTLICSSLTADLLALKFGPQLLNHVRRVDVGECLVLDTGPHQSITVTALDANHCPGAVMFLIEGTFGTVLHTGDFRFHSNMINEPVLSAKKIDYLVVDSTFGFDPCFDFVMLDEAVP
jgi:DNA cross-link repair 1A protein